MSCFVHACRFEIPSKQGLKEAASIYFKWIVGHYGCSHASLNFSFDLLQLKYLDEIKKLKRQVCRTANLLDKFALQRKSRKFEQKQDEAWCDYDATTKQAEVQKGTLLARADHSQIDGLVGGGK